MTTTWSFREETTFCAQPQRHGDSERERDTSLSISFGERSKQPFMFTMATGSVCIRFIVPDSIHTSRSSALSPLEFTPSKLRPFSVV